MGVIAPGHPFRNTARVQVGTVQSLLARAPNLNPKIIVLDECHHYVSDEWRALTERFPSALLLGPTATPQRGDGRPLGDMFSSLVVAAQYSELIADGFLCDAVCYQPPEVVQGGLAQGPLEAWQKFSGGMSGFVFMSTIKLARETAATFSAAGIPAACIDAKTPKAERRETLRKFSDGALQVITNVDTMTEGVDVPRAGVAMLCRSFQTVSAFLQACGRVLRPHPSKQYARIIDLTGATLLHSHPTIDRSYSLDGEGIQKGEAAENPTRNCPRCYRVYLCAETCCPGCGEPPPPRVKRPPRIYSLELQEVWAGENTKEDAKLREYKRLREVQKSKGLRLWWVVKSYKELFGSAPRLFDVTPKEKRDEFYFMVSEGEKRGAKRAYAAARFKDMFGHWPARL
jgi:superfamily II DNA or RNA helicase